MVMSTAVIILKRQPSLRIHKPARNPMRYLPPVRNIKNQNHLMLQIRLILGRKDPVNLIRILTRSSVILRFRIFPRQSASAAGYSGTRQHPLRLAVHVRFLLPVAVSLIMSKLPHPDNLRIRHSRTYL